MSLFRENTVNKIESADGKVKCSYGVPVSNPVASKSFKFRSQTNKGTFNNYVYKKRGREEGGQQKVCLISPWGQSWERFFHKHSCIQFIAPVPFPKIVPMAKLDSA